MVKINKIYTRHGDDGTTGLVGGPRVTKDSARVEAYGEVDELNSMLGWARTLSEREGVQGLTAQISAIQNDLFDIGSELATPPGAEWPGMITVQERHSQQLEKWIDQLIDGIPEL